MASVHTCTYTAFLYNLILFQFFHKSVFQRRFELTDSALQAIQNRTVIVIALPILLFTFFTLIQKQYIKRRPVQPQLLMTGQQYRESEIPGISSSVSPQATTSVAGH